MGETVGEVLIDSYQSKSNSWLSFEDTIEIRKQKKESSNQKQGWQGKDVSRSRKKQAAYKQTVTNSKVPLYGNLRVEEKDKEAVKVLGLNINSLSFCEKENYKAEQLKFTFERYGVDTVRL